MFLQQLKIMNRIFLSHSSSDKDYVRHIADNLGDAAIIDERDFAAGARTMDEIIEKIDDSKIFVAFLSSRALDSDWVQKELALAIQHCRQQDLKILVFSIDKRVDYNDKRIPELIRKNYNIRFIKNPDIALSRIKDENKRIQINNSSVLREIENLFIGRSEQVKLFDGAFSNLDGEHPTFAVASNYYDGMGRRHFMRHCLNNISILKNTQCPVTIPLQRGESIENFIIKLNSYTFSDNEDLNDLHNLSLEKKHTLALDLVKDYKSNNRILFIKDDGAIVLPNHSIVDWFVELTQNEYFHNKFTFCLISTWEPSRRYLNQKNKGVSFLIQELDAIDTQNLFVRLLNIYGQNQLNTGEKLSFLNHLTGIPSQILFTVQQIRMYGSSRALLDAEEIKMHSDSYSAVLLDAISQNTIAYQLCMVLSDSMASLDVLTDVFGDNDKVSEALKFLNDYSALEFISAAQTTVRLNSTLSDFIKRRQLKPDETTSCKLKEVKKCYVETELNKIEVDDYTKLVYAIEECLKDGYDIPEKYYIASLLLRSIFNDYYAGNYKRVERTCKNLLRQTNIDSQVRWELQYHLAKVYARMGRDEFWDALRESKLDDVDREFLIGFYYRNNKTYNERRKALEHFEKVLDMVDGHRRALREIVTTYLLLEDYPNALRYAKTNYENNPSDLLQLQSYFISLIRNDNLNKTTDFKELNELIEQARRNKDKRASDVLRCMEGEYEYYINGNFSIAENYLREASKLNVNPLYPLKALLIIYRKEGMFDRKKEIKEELSKYENL